jgi:hypothetical protein
VPFTQGPRQKKENEVPHINDASSPFSIFLLYFVETITLLVVVTNRYYHDHLDTPDMTEAEVLMFLAITVQRDIACGTN